MKRFYLFIVIVSLFSSSTAFAVSINLSDCAITSTLRLGSRGAEVECLQNNLKLSSVDGIFGPLTKNAVKAFQSSKGLATDGIFGPISRLALNAMLSNSGNYLSGCTSNTGYSPTTGVKCNSSVNPTNPDSITENLNPVVANDEKQKSISENTSTTNSNLTKLDQFIATVVKVSKENGKSEQEIATIVSVIKETVINSDIDYYEKFKELLINESKLSINPEDYSFLSIFDKVISKTFSFLGITPSVAHAAGISFGGTLIFPFFCAYNESWMITISPSKPTFVTLLTYYPGTQGFSGYNTPFTRLLLGTYIIRGVCMIPGPFGIPIVIPTQGTITPLVGSSL